MTGDQSDRIIAQLATLTESVAGLRRDGDRRDEAFEQEKVESHASRKDLHEKVNSAVLDIAAVKSDVRVSAGVSAQARDAVQDLKKTVEANALAVAPTVAQYRQIQSLGKVILFAVGGGGLAAAVTIIGWGDAIRSVVSHWLGIK